MVLTVPIPRSEWKNSAVTSATTPRISIATAAEVTTAIRRTPMTLIAVVSASTIRPRTTAFWAPVGLSGDESAPDPPTSWKPVQIAGSTACIAIAAVATVRIWPMTMIQPVNQPKSVPARRLDHWKIEPEIG